MAEGVVGAGQRQERFEERERRFDVRVELMDAVAQLFLDLQAIVAFLDVELRAKELEDRSIGNGAAVRNAVGLDPVDLIVRDGCVKFVEEARFAQPGLAHDAHDLAMAGLDAPETIVQQGQLASTARELGQPAAAFISSRLRHRRRPVTAYATTGSRCPRTSTRPRDSQRRTPARTGASPRPSGSIRVRPSTCIRAATCVVFPTAV